MYQFLMVSIFVENHEMLSKAKAWQYAHGVIQKNIDIKQTTVFRKKEGQSLFYTTIIHSYCAKCQVIHQNL